MRRWIVFFLGMLLFSACTPYMYGVPQPTWDSMSPQERQQAMRIYEDEQRSRQRAQEEHARQQAMEMERQRARQAEEERRQRERIEAIHRGEGAYGDLVRVRLKGGEMRIGGRHRHFEPFSFRIADGESRMIEVADSRGREAGLLVTYTDRALYVDDPGAGSGIASRLPYDLRWGSGMLYPNTGTDGPLQLRGVDIFVEIVGRRDWSERDAPPRIIVIRDEERRHPEPPVVIVKEEKRRDEPPVVIVREDERRRPEPPPVVVIREDKTRHRPGDERHDERYDRKPPVPPLAERFPGRIELQFLRGEVREKGRQFPIVQQSIRLADGETREVVLKTLAGSYPVAVSYRDGAVIIDGNLADGIGKGNVVRLPSEPEWKKGRTYSIDTKGRLRLENAEVRIVTVDGKWR